MNDRLITRLNEGTGATNGRRGWPLHNLGVKVSEVVRGQRREVVALSAVTIFVNNMEIVRLIVRIGVAVVMGRCRLVTADALGVDVK